jgi:hypothetical protein
MLIQATLAAECPRKTGGNNRPVLDQRVAPEENSVVKVRLKENGLHGNFFP